METIALRHGLPPGELAQFSQGTQIVWGTQRSVIKLFVPTWPEDARIEKLILERLVGAGLPVPQRLLQDQRERGGDDALEAQLLVFLDTLPPLLAAESVLMHADLTARRLRMGISDLARTAGVRTLDSRMRRKVGHACLERSAPQALALERRSSRGWSRGVRRPPTGRSARFAGATRIPG